MKHCSTFTIFKGHKSKTVKGIKVKKHQSNLTFITFPFTPVKVLTGECSTIDMSMLGSHGSFGAFSLISWGMVYPLQIATWDLSVTAM